MKYILPRRPGILAVRIDDLDIIQCGHQCDCRGDPYGQSNLCGGIKCKTGYRNGGLGRTPRKYGSGWIFTLILPERVPGRSRHYVIVDIGIEPAIGRGCGNRGNGWRRPGGRYDQIKQELRACVNIWHRLGFIDGISKDRIGESRRRVQNHIVRKSGGGAPDSIGHICGGGNHLQAVA